MSKLKKLNQKGFGHLELVLLVVIAVIIGGVGYYVYKANSDTKNSKAETAVTNPIAPTGYNPTPTTTTDVLQEVQQSTGLSADAKTSATTSIQAERSAVAAVNSGEAARASTPVCKDGESGARFQLVYMRRKDDKNRLPDLQQRFRDLAATIDANYQKSSAPFNVKISPRWVRNKDCSINIKEVILPAKTDVVTNTQATWGIFTQQLKSKDRKYIGFLDNKDAVVAADVASDKTPCSSGATWFPEDDNPSQKNIANQSTGHFFMTTKCYMAQDWYKTYLLTWAATSMQGAVKKAAPNATQPNGGSCTDGADPMCSSWGMKDRGLPLVCSGTTSPTDPNYNSDNFILDCGKDDYFNPNPKPGNYLYDHWNVANSRYLIRK